MANKAHNVYRARKRAVEDGDLALIGRAKDNQTGPEGGGPNDDWRVASPGVASTADTGLRGGVRWVYDGES